MTGPADLDAYLRSLRPIAGVLDLETPDRGLVDRVIGALVEAEAVNEEFAEAREPFLKDAGYGRWSWRRPFITHFTGCQPCSGKHNQMYSGESCWDGMQKALNFADNQVLRSFGFEHPDLLDSASVLPLPLDFPA